MSGDGGGIRSDSGFSTLLVFGGIESSEQPSSFLLDDDPMVVCSCLDEEGAFLVQCWHCTTLDNKQRDIVLNSVWITEDGTLSLSVNNFFNEILHFAHSLTRLNSITHSMA